MAKLKVFIKRVRNVVLFDVLEQDKSIRFSDNDVLGIFEFKASNGIKIISKSVIDLTQLNIYLKGNIKDSRMAICRFSSEKEAIKVFDDYLQALREFKENNYFDGHSQQYKVKKEEEDVYTF